LVGVQRAMDATTRDGDDATTARRLSVAGDVVAGVGIVAAGTGLTLLLMEKYGKPKRTVTNSRHWVVPVVMPAGLGIFGRF
jgi:diphthamide biosynthesis methyltransferase